MGGLSLFDDPVALHCKDAAKQWLQARDPLIQDFGARLMAVLSSQEVSISQRGPHVPEGLPAEFEHYPWAVGTLLGPAEHKNQRNQLSKFRSAPLRQFYALDDSNGVGLRLGVFWTAPQWHYSPHVYKSLELHHRLSGQGRYFTKNAKEMETIPMAPGDTYLHLPSNIYGFESWDEPLLTLWAERVVDPGRVPRLLSELQVMATDQVTSALQRAAHLWLQSEDPAVELFGRKLLVMLKPRMKSVQKAAPPEGMVPKDFRSAPWYPSLAYTSCKDSTLIELRDCIMYKSEDAMFGMFYLPPGVYYPAHRHEPLEIYHVIQGKARFFLAEAEAEANHSSAASSCSAKIHGPESFWLHQPYQSHGLQTLDLPVLILWGWIGELDSDFHYLPGDIFQHAKVPCAKL